VLADRETQQPVVADWETQQPRWLIHA
jgi:hypothetical protein